MHKIFYILKYIFNSILGTYGVKIEAITQLCKYLLCYLFIVIIVTLLAPVINISYDGIFFVITFYFLHRIFYVLKYIFNSILGTYGVKIEAITQLYKYLLCYLFIVIM